MLFSSITFLYYFLPIVLAVYFLVPRRGKNLVLRRSPSVAESGAAAGQPGVLLVG